MRQRRSRGSPIGPYTPKRLDHRAAEAPREPAPEARPPAASPWQSVADYLKALRFQRRLVGGVDEADVWRKLERLNSLYEEALRAERVRYDALLERQRRESPGEDGTGDG